LPSLDRLMGWVSSASTSLTHSGLTNKLILDQQNKMTNKNSHNLSVQQQINRFEKKAKYRKKRKHSEESQRVELTVLHDAISALDKGIRR